MAVAEGKFVLYSRIEPPLEAGDYRLTAKQELTAAGPNGSLTASSLPVAEHPTHLRVRSPRFQLPPDQVLSTFPPANSEGAYGMRLPQVVIKRRTLPWERLLAPDRRGTPWLALVVIAEGEAELRTNQPVAECITPGVTLAGAPDVEVGHTLVVRRSMIDKIFPTRLDVPLLAHAREVDIHDTELMMGDDDGFLAVVIANRLPLAGRDPEGNEAPVKYLACLINLEGQFDQLLEKAPEPQTYTVNPYVIDTAVLTLATADHLAMGSPNIGPRPSTMVGQPVVEGLARSAVRAAPGADAAIAAAAALAPEGATIIAPLKATHEIAAAPQAASQWTHAESATRAGADVYLDMARPFSRANAVRGGLSVYIDPSYRFPVLLHWSFTSTGSVTYRGLMEGLDSGLLGTVPELPAGAEPEPLAGRAPLEVVETGHVGLVHRTRLGDATRIWYRGPAVPHPTVDPPEGRLALAHAADQLRIVVPDGREDLSLASAFEIGRLMALARPSMVAALLRWRQVQYQTARRRAIWEEQRGFLQELLAAELPKFIPRTFGIDLGRALAGAIAGRPGDFLGAPGATVTAGRPLGLDVKSVAEAIATGYALDVKALQGDQAIVLANLRATPVMVAPIAGMQAAPVGVARAKSAADVDRDALSAVLDQHVAQLVADTLAPELRATAKRSTARSTTAASAPAPDALDRLIGRLGRSTRTEG